MATEVTAGSREPSDVAHQPVVSGSSYGVFRADSYARLTLRVVRPLHGDSLVMLDHSLEPSEGRVVLVGRRLDNGVVVEVNTMVGCLNRC
jgi:hypothetical protein